MTELKHTGKKRNVGLIWILFVLISIIFVVGLFLGETEEDKRKKTQEITVQLQKQKAIEKYRQSPEYLTEMQEKLGPDWKMIKLTQDSWSGPYNLKNGSGWKIARGEIWVKKGKNSKPYRDKSGVHRYGGGNKVYFSAYSKTAIIFFMH